jgi:hypothetical protein
VDKILERKIKVSINDLYPGEKIETGDDRWGEFNGGFITVEITVKNLLEAIKKGDAFCPALKRPWRKGDNFESTQYLCLDFDTEDARSSFATLKKTEFVKDYGTFLYTSLNHSSKKPRSRVGFILDQPIMDGSVYLKYIQAMLKLFGIADKHGSDLTRLWYGSHPGTGKIEVLGKELPVAVLDRMVELDKPKEDGDKFFSEKSDEISEAALNAVLSLIAVSTWDDRNEWVAIGMAIQTAFPSELGLEIWKRNSQKSTKYKDGDCEREWKSFHPDRENKRGIGTIFYYARRDDPAGYALMSENLKILKRITTEEYLMVLKEFGYEFRECELDASIEANGVRLEDNEVSVIKSKLRDRGYNSVNVAKDAYISYAHTHTYHPIKEYLEGLKWDGNNHIEKLSGFFMDTDNMFDTWLKRWLVGSIAKIYVPNSFNRMLVLDGIQGLGKSKFVEWLAQGVPNYFAAGQIQPENKDHRISQMLIWIYEAKELGAVMRKEDVEGLKGFLDQKERFERLPYGEFPIRRPAITNYIGTINNEHGFLKDPTGNRRFMVSTLAQINWSYWDKVDYNQVWAQAKHLFDNGEPWELRGAEEVLANKYNANYEVHETVDDYLAEFVINAEEDIFTSSLDLLKELKMRGASGADNVLSRNIATYIKRVFDAEPKPVRTGRITQRGYRGIKILYPEP